MGDLYRIAGLRKQLESRTLGHPLHYLERLDSTNDWMKKAAEQGAPEGAVILAGEQTRGRGRMGKSWLSPPDRGIYMTVLLRPRWPGGEAGLLSMLAGLAVARALERLQVSAVALKWPNDVVVKGRKIGGVLVETRLDGGWIEFAVLGIGINVRHSAEELREVWGGRATSLLEEGLTPAGDDIVLAALDALAELYQSAKRGDRDALFTEWSKKRHEGLR